MSWFGSSSKNIKPQDLDALLRDISILDRAEREYVKGLFHEYKDGGINRSEVEKAVREMKLNTSDIIEPAEAEAIKEKLLAML